MRLTRTLLLAIPAALLSGAPASAQMEPTLGSKIERPAPADINPHAAPADRARQAIMAFSRCTALSHRAAAERVLALPYGTTAYDKAMTALADDECLRAGEIRMSGSLMRGGLYAELYRLDFRNAPVKLRDPPIDFAADVGGGNPEAPQYVALRQFADCTVRLDAIAARALILAPIASGAETAAFGALSPHFSACMAKGQSLEFSKLVLLGLIAEVLYRDSKPTVAAPARP